jgi:hypothetical protein
MDNDERATTEREPRAVTPSEAPPPVEKKPLYAGDGPLSPCQASTALEEFRETVIRNEMAIWEPHRSILRDDMIETFVTQRLSSPEDWFRKVPQVQRAETSPVEKNLFLVRICEIVERIDERTETRSVLAPDTAEVRARISLSPRPSPANPSSGEQPRARNEYVVADVAKLQVTPRADQFYHLEYRATIARMVAYIIQIEGPIYDNLLLSRIARIHGFQKAGATIQKLVRSAVDHQFPRTMEDGREVFWAPGASTEIPVSFRKSSENIRSHADIPIAELASLALPFVHAGMDSGLILRKMTAHFGLTRLRESTRIRFQKAISFAKSAVS